MPTTGTSSELFGCIGILALPVVYVKGSHNVPHQLRQITNAAKQFARGAFDAHRHIAEFDSYAQKSSVSKD
jgi:hypothetical protein